MAIAADLEVELDFTPNIVGQRQEPRLVKLGGTNQQSAFVRFVIPDGQAEQFASAQSGGEQQHHNKAEQLRPQGRVLRGPEARALIEEHLDFSC